MPRIPSISVLARSQIQRSATHQFRRYATARAAPANFASPTRRVGNTMMMYIPVVATVMFWPYAVAPIMNFVEEHAIW